MNRLRTTGLAAVAVTTTAAVFVGGLAVGRGLDSPASPPDRVVRAAGPLGLVAGSRDLSVADDCDDLLQWYVTRGLRKVGPWGWDSPMYYALDDVARTEVMGSAQSAEAPAALNRATEQSSSATGTNVQEVGVDEPDLVKTDGRILVRADDDVVTVYDVTGEAPALMSRLQLSNIGDAELLLVGDRVVVIGTDTASLDSAGAAPSDVGRDRFWPGAWSVDTRVMVLDLATPGSPQIVADTAYDSSLVSARQHGDVVRLLLSSDLPELDFVTPNDDTTERQAAEANRDLVRATALSDWLPTLTTARGGSASEPIVDCADVALPSQDGGLGTISVIGFDPAAPETWSSVAMASSSEVAYLSTDRLYLATNPWGDGSVGWWDGLRRVLPGVGGREDGESVVHSFALDGLDTDYVATGTVEGWIQDRWAMDSADGVLRLAVSPTSQTGNFNSVITLAERGTALVEQGRADKLGVNEEIKSVRWFDDLAIVVTFRQTDPLYAIDLADPSAPRVLGKLKIPGFSEYLHPVGSSQLIGIGQNADEKTGQTLGAQAALFDITDLTDPLRLDVVSYRKNSWAGAANDPRQFTWLPDSRTALTVVAQGWQGTTGWVSTLTVDGNTLRNDLVAVEYGSDVAKVRLVPLPSGKVVLVTGEDVSFFPLPR